MNAHCDVMVRIYVLYTGGTFGMAGDGPTGDRPLKPLPLDHLEAFLPPADQVVPGLNVVLEGLEQPLDSSSIKPENWLEIAQKIQQNYDHFDGFIVIHGTDTLAYTASALSFIFDNLAKPVVITGSQIPLLKPVTDAQDNYSLALRVAAARTSKKNQPLPEVIVAFGGMVLRGNRCRKMNTSDWATFSSPNYKPLGSFANKLRLNASVVRRQTAPKKKFTVNKQLETGVIDITLFPGITSRFIAKVLDDDSLRGLVLRTYGAGNAPEAPEFIATLKKGLQERGIIAIGVSQCPHGAVQFGRYAANMGLVECGVIPGGDMTPEAALTKLMVFLPLITREKDEQLIQNDLRGEITN